jgi:hypothetical protein
MSPALINIFVEATRMLLINKFHMPPAYWHFIEVVLQEAIKTIIPMI